MRPTSISVVFACYYLNFFGLGSALAIDIDVGDITTVAQERNGSDHTVLDPRNPTQFSVKAYPLPYDGQNGAYYIPVKVGAFEYKLFFDTGSPFMWVPSEKAKNPEYEGQPKYPWTSSDDCAEKGSFEYGGDRTKVTGILKQDTVVVGDGPPVKPKFMSASEVQDKYLVYTKGAFNGMIGANRMGFPWSSKQQFAVDYTGSSDTSRVYFGALPMDPKKMNVMPAVDDGDGLWKVKAAATSVGNVGLDSGAAALTLPAAFIQIQLLSTSAKPNKDGIWYINCDEDLPEFKITLGGQEYKIPGARLKLQLVGANSKTCKTLLQSKQGNEPSLLGTPFFEQYKLYFDRVGKQVGIEKRS